MITQHDHVEELVQAVRTALTQRNSYAALALALALPDICASCDPQSPPKVGDRYSGWWNTYVGHHYKHKIGARSQEHVFMNGEECYFLRCVFLHQGLDTLAANQVKRTVDKFYFVQPASGMVIHQNQMNNVLNLQVDQFCEEICQGVESWLRAERHRPEVAARIEKLTKISLTGDGMSPYIVQQN